MNFAYSSAVKRPQGSLNFSSSSKFTRRAMEDSPESPPSLSMDTQRGSQEGNDYPPLKSYSPEQDFSSVYRLREDKMPMGQLGCTAQEPEVWGSPYKSAEEIATGKENVPLGQHGRTANEPENPKAHEHFTWESYKTAEEIGTTKIKTAFHYGLRERFFYIARKNLHNRRPTVIRFSFMEAFKLKKLLDLVLRQCGELESRFDVIPLLADDWDLATEKYDKSNEQYFWRVTHLDTGTLRVRITFSKIHHDYVIFLNNIPTPNLAAVFPNWIGSMVSFTSINLIRRLRDYLQYHLMIEEQ